VLQEVLNRPYFLRLTLYGEIQSDEEGAQLIESVNNLRNYVSQEDRKDQIAMKMNRFENEDGSIVTTFDGYDVGDIEDFE